MAFTLRAFIVRAMEPRTLAVFSTAWLLCACSGAGPVESNLTFSADPLVELGTDSAQLKVEVRTLPSQPPTLGASSVQMIVRDTTTGEPVSGEQLQVVPWMPAMGHGTSVTPTVTETAPGTYELTGVVLFMPGTWQLRTTLNGAFSDHVVPTLQVH
jgi:hypothetical protein